MKSRHSGLSRAAIKTKQVIKMMSTKQQLIRTLIISGVLAYLAFASQSSEAASVASQSPETQITADELPALLEAARSSGLLKQFEQADGDDEDDDKSGEAAEQLTKAETAALLAQASSQKVLAAPRGDLKTSASHHYHGHGAKGWLDMGAWTGKKGAFGWYDKHPVGGKGK